MRHGVEVQGRTLRIKNEDAVTYLARPDPLIEEAE